MFSRATYSVVDDLATRPMMELMAISAGKIAAKKE